MQAIDELMNKLMVEQFAAMPGEDEDDDSGDDDDTDEPEDDDFED